MSCNYAEGLSPYENKGKLGGPEKFDNPAEVEEKVSQLADMVRNSKHIVVHTGAGISTSAGIPDFRGPKGVWTLEKKGLKPDMNVSWDDAKPTKTHMALARLVTEDKVKFIITQNIDGLHLRSGVPRKCISELHGNMFVDQCNKCNKMVVRDSPAPTVGQKLSNVDCPAYRDNGRKCRGKLRDFVLDWEDSLPDDDLTISDTHSMMADLSIVMGSTLQIIPAGNMPTYTKKYHNTGKLVICNLQPTKHLKKADLNIHTYVDDVMELLMKKLGLEIPVYNPDMDPVKHVRLNMLPEEGYINWTQCSELARKMKKVGDQIHDNFLAEKRMEKKRKYLEQKEERLNERKEEDIKAVAVHNGNNKMRKRGKDEEIEIIDVPESKPDVKPEIQIFDNGPENILLKENKEAPDAKPDKKPDIQILENGPEEPIVQKGDEEEFQIGKVESVGEKRERDVLPTVSVETNQVTDSDNYSVKEESSSDSDITVIKTLQTTSYAVKPCHTETVLSVTPEGIAEIQSSEKSSESKEAVLSKSEMKSSELTFSLAPSSSSPSSTALPLLVKSSLSTSERAILLAEQANMSDDNSSSSSSVEVLDSSVEAARVLC